MYYIFPIKNILTCSDDVLVGSVESSVLVDKYKRYSKQEWLEHIMARGYVR